MARLHTINAALAAALSMLHLVQGAALDPRGAASEVVKDSSGLFPFETVQLTEDAIGSVKESDYPDLSLFSFRKDKIPLDSSRSASKPSGSKKCKTYPEDKEWPSKKTWQALDKLMGGGLIKTVPEPSYCYKDTEWHNFDATKCENLTTNWRDSFAR